MTPQPPPYTPTGLRDRFWTWALRKAAAKMADLVWEDLERRRRATYPDEYRRPYDGQ